MEERKKYNIILADPPWKYDYWSLKGKQKAGEAHYPTMPLEDICNLPVGGLANKDCALFLWTTPVHLDKSLDVINAWGFTYKSVAFVWVKLNKSGVGFFMGCGRWTRANPEFCLLATRGSPRRVSASVRQLVVTPRQQHSRKPDEVHHKIVDLMGDLPRIELFARRPFDGWDVWGNEVASDIDLVG